MPAYRPEDDGWTPSGACKWRRDGDEFAYVWPDGGIGISLENIREASSGEMHAEITVYKTNAATGNHLHLARLNLWSTTARASLANHLDKAFEANWRGHLEQVCTITLRQWRMGRTVIDLATVPRMVAARDAITNFIPLDDTSLVYTDGGGGKSTLALACCASFVTGRPVADGMTATVQGPVYYLDWETNEVLTANRLRAILAGMGIPRIPEGMFHYRPMFRPLVEESNRLRAEASRLGIKFMVVDSALGAIGESAVGDDVASRFMNTLRGFTGTSRLVIGHVNSVTAQNKPTQARPFGSVQFWNLGRSLWELRKSEEIPAEDGMAVALFHRKYNAGRLKRPIGLRVIYDGDPDNPDTITFRRHDVQGDASLSPGLVLGQRIRDALSHADGTHGLGKLDTNELAEAVDSTPNSVSKTARRMKDVAMIPGRGRGNVTVFHLREDRDTAPRWDR